LPAVDRGSRNQLHRRASIQPFPHCPGFRVGSCGSTSSPTAKDNHRKNFPIPVPPLIEALEINYTEEHQYNLFRTTRGFESVPEPVEGQPPGKCPNTNPAFDRGSRNQLYKKESIQTFPHCPGFRVGSLACRRTTTG
jgi:hypothetical protein